MLPTEIDRREEQGGSKGRWPWIVGAILLLAGGLIVFRFNPTEYRFYPQCAFHQFTGLQCPGCGSTRAIHALLHGEIVTALKMNTLLVGLLPVGAWFGLRFLVQRFTGRLLPHPFQHYGWGMALAAAVILFWIFRNFPLINP